MWYEIGTGLGFTHNELSNIQAKTLGGSPYKILSTILADWVQWVPGDGRGSQSYATRESLRTALKKAGLGVLAEQL